MFMIGMIFISIQSPASAVDLGRRPVKLFLLGGQSNMDGCGRGEELPAMFRSHPKNVVTWDNQKKIWIELTKDSMAVARRQQFGPEMAFDHPETSAMIKAHHHRINNLWLRRKKIELKTVGDMHLADRFNRIENRSIDFRANVVGLSLELGFVR